METSAKTAMNVNDIFLAIGKSQVHLIPCGLLCSFKLGCVRCFCVWNRLSRFDTSFAAKKLPKNEPSGQRPPRTVDLNEDNSQGSSNCCKWSKFHTHSVVVHVTLDFTITERACVHDLLKGCSRLAFLESLLWACVWTRHTDVSRAVSTSAFQVRLASEGSKPDLSQPRISRFGFTMLLATLKSKRDCHRRQ